MAQAFLHNAAGAIKRIRPRQAGAHYRDTQAQHAVDVTEIERNIWSAVTRHRFGWRDMSRLETAASRRRTPKCWRYPLQQRDHNQM